MFRLNDVDLATHVRNVQTYAGQLDSVMANGKNHDLFKVLLRIVEHAQDGMHQLNVLGQRDRDAA